MRQCGRKDVGCPGRHAVRLWYLFKLSLWGGRQGCEVVGKQKRNAEVLRWEGTGHVHVRGKEVSILARCDRQAERKETQQISFTELQGLSAVNEWKTGWRALKALREGAAMSRCLCQQYHSGCCAESALWVSLWSTFSMEGFPEVLVYSRGHAVRAGNGLEPGPGGSCCFTSWEPNFLHLKGHGHQSQSHCVLSLWHPWGILCSSCTMLFAWFSLPLTLSYCMIVFIELCIILNKVAWHKA